MKRNVLIALLSAASFLTIGMAQAATAENPADKPAAEAMSKPEEAAPKKAATTHKKHHRKLAKKSEPAKPDMAKDQKADMPAK